MPVYLHLSNLIFKKSIIAAQYQGGCPQFRKDWKIGTSQVNQEDDELFLLAKMNPSDFDLQKIADRGIDLDFDNLEHCALINRYDNSTKPSKWLDHNQVFAWHVDCLEEHKQKAKEIAESTVDQLEKQLTENPNLFSAISSRSKKL